MKLLILPCFMLAVLPVIAQKKDTIPEYDRQLLKSNYKPFLIQVPIKAPALYPAGAEPNQYLFWYKGKKINDSILVTPDNTLVYYSKKKGTIVLEKPKKADPVQKIIAVMQKDHEAKKMIYTTTFQSSTTVMWVPSVEKSIINIDLQNQEFADIFKNYLILPSALPPPATASRGGKASNQWVYNVPAYIKAAYEKLLADKKNYPPITFDTPPASDMGACNKCDSSDVNARNNQEYRWREEFVRYEYDLINRAQQISRSIHLTVGSTLPEATQMLDPLSDVIDFAGRRLRNKIDLLLRNHGYEMTTMQVSVNTALMVERFVQLNTNNMDGYGPVMNHIAAIMKKYSEYLDKQFELRNYNVVLNIEEVFRLARFSELLGMEEPAFIAEYWEKLMRFNRFRIEIDMSFQGKPNCTGSTRETMNARNRETYYIALGKLNCKFQFIPHQSGLDKHPPGYHFGEGFSIPMKVDKGFSIADETDDDGNCIPRTKSYAGEEFSLGGPSAMFTFCDDEQDSLVISPAVDSEPGRHSTYDEFTMLLFVDNPNHTDPPGMEELADKMNEFIEMSEHRYMSGTPLPKNIKDSKIMYQESLEHLALSNNIEFLEDFRKETIHFFDAVNFQPLIVNEEANFTIDAFPGEPAHKMKIRVRITHDPEQKN